MQGEEPVENLVTWVYEEGSYVPVAKIQNGERYTIISDYIGRPVEAYNSYGNVVWQADYDVYGDLLNIKGIRDFIPSDSWDSMRTMRLASTTTASAITIRG